jgi:hypothetical protein
MTGNSLALRAEMRIDISNWLIGQVINSPAQQLLTDRFDQEVPVSALNSLGLK